jgi:monovalent cation:H+ antiporter-2, CPA2 family
MSPIRDAFAVLFFVSVGMLFNPMILVEQPLLVGVTFLITVIGNATAASTIAFVFG